MNINPTAVSTSVPVLVDGKNSAVSTPLIETQSITAVSPANLLQQSSNETSKDNEQKISPNELYQVVKNLNSHVRSMATEFNFSVDEDAGEMVLTVKDANSGDVIRQIPSEEALRIIRNAQKALETTMSVLVDQRV
ncbi:MAG: flagellar protein FlaG [Gammaproteobacteria bacterium]|nr:flagellar protein FlaG [Gammaproteobacteria bacterium]